MGLPWIKVREDLHEDPAVLSIASQLNTRPEHVVGYCVRFWGWVSRNCHGGSVTGVTLLSVESVLNLPGFCDMLRDVGWLHYDDSGPKPVITIPNYDRHLSDGAKERALATERKCRERKRKEADEGQKTANPAIAHCHDTVTNMSRCERDESVTRGEERRGEKKINTTHTHAGAGAVGEIVIPPEWDAAIVLPAVDRWLAWLAERNIEYSPLQLTATLAKCAADKWDAAKFARAVDASISWRARAIRDPDVDFAKEKVRKTTKPQPYKQDLSDANTIPF